MSKLTTPVLIQLDFHVNQEVKTKMALKRANKESDQTAQEAIAIMAEERHQLEKELVKKGWTFEELLHFLNKKKYVQPT